MSISSISANGAATATPSAVAKQSLTAQTQPPAEAASGKTTVTLSAESATYQNSAPSTPATQIAAQYATAKEQAQAVQLGGDVLENSQLILQTGQDDMATAMQSFAKDWQAEKQTIAQQRPDLLNQRWDIVTDQGTIQVVSSTLSASDKAWLTGILNQNANLVADTQTINTIIVSTFGGTAAMAASDPTGMTLSNLNQGSVDGAVHFLALLEAADTSSYNVAIHEVSYGEKFFKVIAPVGSVLNNPVAGSISPIEDLDPVWAEDGTLAFPHWLQVRPDESHLPGMYADTLDVAFQKFPQPAFASSSALDGTDVLAGLNIPANVLATVSDTSPFNGTAALKWLDAGALGYVQCQTQAQLKASAASLSAALGAAYRTYGEALPGLDKSATQTSSVAAGATPGQTAASPAQLSTQAAQPGASASNSTPGSAATASTSAVTGNASDAVSGVGAINNVYDGNGQSLSPVQKAIRPAMQSLEGDWNAVKAVIAAQRPELLNQKWDFVTDNGTVQVVSNTLTAEQKSWLTGILNQSQNLVATTQTINKQLVIFYQDNPLGNAPVSGQTKGALPSLTQQDIDGIIPFLALMAGADPATLILQGLENEMNGLSQTTPGYVSQPSTISSA